MENYLLLTLGHNSSAIFIDEDGQVIGYEQERLNRMKSSSQFPIDAIQEIQKHVSPSKMKDCKIRISHWFNSNWNPTTDFNKHYTKEDYLYLLGISNNINSVSNMFTHHDAHAYSVKGFYDFHKTNDVDYHTIVCDGFGNDGEVISIYKTTKEKGYPVLIDRVYGYYNSLGILYQHATSFTNMKENQDEYKYLGYESHIDEYLDENQIIVLSGMAVVKARTMKMDGKNTEKSYTNDLGGDLKKVKDKLYKEFNVIVNEFNDGITSDFKARVIIGYYVQKVCESYLRFLIEDYHIENLCVAGGTFYNVKLNNYILQHINGQFCVIPLAGDQGAAIGFYVHECPKQFNFSTLCIGKRTLYDIEKKASKDNIIVLDSKNVEENAKLIARDIANGMLVNLVTGNMEFGPRALCNTSTLFIPTTKNTADNNTMNKRNEVMPCAPVMLKRNADKLFDTNELNRVIGSDQFMICTHDYQHGYSENYGGVMHKKTLVKDTYTGRPQIIANDSNHVIRYILEEVENLTGVKCLVNTSYNVHGHPIVFDTFEIIDNFKFQCEHSIKKNQRLYTLK